jgi:preprotein translocase subunit SecA
MNPWSSTRLGRYRAVADRIVSRSDGMTGLEDEALTELGRRIAWEARTGTPLRRLLPEAFALVREVSRRVLRMAHFPVQLMGGMALFEGRIAEMQTGEGKTLTAALPTFLHALVGKGCHVVTTNDYLARRDAELLGPVYEKLGLTVGRVCADSTPEERREAYGRDITYGTAQEIGFDFLRDRLQQPPGLLSMLDLSDPLTRGEMVQRGHHFVLIDEADSILLDEARTPLIIGLEEANDPSTVYLYRWCRRTIRDLKRDVDFTFEPEHRRVELTHAGCRNVLLWSKSTLLSSVDTERIYQHIEHALTAELGFRRDRDYVVVKDEVQIVDESTGRIMEGRKWQQGLHQSIEAKERLPITAATGEAARITLQSFFRLYRHVAGMTGTARSARRELKHVYGRRVTVIPTHRPCIRKGFPPRIFATMEAKRNAIVDEIERRHATGQPILVGTPSVAASEALGALLKTRRLPHQILNAYLHEKEAEMMSRAGEVGLITIATNMAGRGTDIRLADAAKPLGGLHVIATEMHSSARIDRQLIGRAARLGDPGSYQFFLSLEDELFHCLTPEQLSRRRRGARPANGGELAARTWMPLFHRTQRFLEKLHAKSRRDLLRQEKQRAISYRQMGLDPCLELTEN